MSQKFTTSDGSSRIFRCAHRLIPLFSNAELGKDREHSAKCEGVCQATDNADLRNSIYTDLRLSVVDLVSVELEDLGGLGRSQHRMEALAVTLRDDLYVVLRLVVRRDAVVFIDRALAGVVARQREFNIA